MSNRTMTEGNLALALALDLDRAPFTVVDGYKDRCVKVQERPRAHRAKGMLIALLCIVALGTVAVASLVCGQAAYDRALASPDRAEIVVAAGDTLWDIASEHGIDGLSTEDTVHVVRAWNDLDSATLRPGASLVVPA